MPRQRLALRVERRDLFGPIIVGQLNDLQPFQHGGALFGTALLRVKRNNTPGYQVRSGEEFLSPCVQAKGQTDRCQQNSQPVPANVDEPTRDITRF
jgi:hypothetical protein